MPASGENLRINPDRLWDSIHALAEIGPGVAGGSNRQTLTDDDAKGRTMFQSWCEGAGLSMGLDQMGTMFARREGTDPSLDPVYIGSHLDTQPTGGRYDGVLGVPFRPRGHPHPQRSRHQNAPADRRGQLDQ